MATPDQPRWSSRPAPRPQDPRPRDAGRRRHHDGKGATLRPRSLDPFNQPVPFRLGNPLRRDVRVPVKLLCHQIRVRHRAKRRRVLDHAIDPIRELQAWLPRVMLPPMPGPFDSPMAVAAFSKLVTLWRRFPWSLRLAVKTRRRLDFQIDIHAPDPLPRFGRDPRA